MFRKGKGLMFDPTRPAYGLTAGGLLSEGDAKVMSKHKTLAQEFNELQQESDAMRSKLQAAKLKKLTLAAEVRFLRRRRKLLVELKTSQALQADRVAQIPNPVKQIKTKKAQVLTSNHHRLPPKPVAKLNKKRYVDEQATVASTSSPSNDFQKILCGGKATSRQHLTPTSVLNYKGRMNMNHEMFAWKVPLVDLNQERIQSPRAAFDLNQESIYSGKQQPSLPTRTPIFDLNEISTGDEDFQNYVEAPKFDEAKKSFISGLNNEQQNDLMLSMCRNTGEGSSSRMSKRKISWQDPVVLF